jgi:hypothetical protein
VTAGRWRSGGGGSRRAPPVEMRFVDMFMAALGALVFMAMLMAFLLRFYPRSGALPPPPSKPGEHAVQPFKLTTRSVPAAQAGEAYEFAFAFQGGVPPAVWEVAAGEHDLPAKLAFDPATGTLAGIPERAITARFVVKARDQLGTVDSRPYELVVKEAATGSRKVERWLGVVMFVAVLVLWIFSILLYRAQKDELALILQARAQGQSTVHLSAGRGQVKVIQIQEGGAETSRAAMQAMRKVAWFFSVVVLALGCWLAWRTWRS